MNRGIALMIAATIVFAVQDGLSRHLADAYSVWLVVMIRYWFFAAFVIALAARQPGGLRVATRSNVPLLQITRGLLLAGEICVMITAFVMLGLAASHAIFAIYPLLITAFAGPVLGEHAGWRRWAAVAVGFAGVLIILRPGAEAISPGALVALLSAAMFAVYGLLTRLVSRHDPVSVSFFWTGVAGAVLTTAVGIWHWEVMSPANYAWMATLCVTGVSGHWLLIRAYDLSPASEVQPFAYLQLVFATAIGVLVFGELLEWPLLLGGALIVGAGIFTIRRQARSG
ncbi:MAG: DMT family transporter [Pseudomonadota bacterium]